MLSQVVFEQLETKKKMMVRFVAGILNLAEGTLLESSSSNMK